MAFVFEPLSIEEIKERYSTTRDTMLAQVCRRIVAAVQDMDGDGTPTLTLAQLESMDNDFSDWQTRQRDKRADGGDVQVIDVNGIARKVNADTETHGIRAVRRDKGTTVFFVKDAVYRPAEGDESESE